MVLLAMAQQLLRTAKGSRQNLYQLLQMPRTAALWRHSRLYDHSVPQKHGCLWLT